MRLGLQGKMKVDRKVVGKRHDMRRLRFHLIFALGWGVAVAAASWLLVSPASPLASPSDSVLQILGSVHIVPTILASMLSGNIHGGTLGEIFYWVLVICQWSVVALAISLIFRKPGAGNTADGKSALRGPE
jgi:hypothetical protein